MTVSNNDIHKKVTNRCTWCGRNGFGLRKLPLCFWGKGSATPDYELESGHFLVYCMSKTADQYQFQEL